MINWLKKLLGIDLIKFDVEQSKGDFAWLNQGSEMQSQAIVKMNKRLEDLESKVNDPIIGEFYSTEGFKYIDPLAQDWVLFRQSDLKDQVDNKIKVHGVWHDRFFFYSQVCDTLRLAESSKFTSKPKKSEKKWKMAYASSKE